MRKHSMIKHAFVCLIILLSLLELADSTLITVDQNDSLQAAIYVANPGDTILVNAEEYYENLYLNKSLILQGVGMPVIDGEGKGQVITLAANDCSLIGFMIKNSSKSSEKDGGIIIISNNNTIKRNIVENTSSAIFLSDCSNNTIDSNRAIYNDYGIFLSVSDNNTIIGNNFTSNNKNGITLKSSESNDVIMNNASSNCRYGIFIKDSDFNSFKNNNISTNSKQGIDIDNSDFNIFTNNSVGFNKDSKGYGIYLYDSWENIISKNIIQYNAGGFLFTLFAGAILNN